MDEALAKPGEISAINPGGGLPSASLAEHLPVGLELVVTTEYYVLTTVALTGCLSELAARRQRCV